MLTSVWGPPMWLFLHAVSFNYPNPTPPLLIKNTIVNLFIILDISYLVEHCRMNLKKNLKMMPLRVADLKNRDAFSRWVFKLHELVNTMLGKESGLKYCDIRDRYEHFRSRCTKDVETSFHEKTSTAFKENAEKRGKWAAQSLCMVRKSKCVVKIIPQNKRVPSFQIDKKCIKKKAINL